MKRNKSKIEAFLLNISNKICIPKIVDVKEYLFCYPDILKPLQIAYKTARKIFPKSQLSLEVYSDPEIIDEYLVLYIRQKQYNEQFLKKVDKIFEKYEKELINVKGWFIVTTDFNPPILENKNVL